VKSAGNTVPWPPLSLPGTDRSWEVYGNARALSPTSYNHLSGSCLGTRRGSTWWDSKGSNMLIQLNTRTCRSFQHGGTAARTPPTLQLPISETLGGTTSRRLPLIKGDDHSSVLERSRYTMPFFTATASCVWGCWKRLSRQLPGTLKAWHLWQ